MPMIPVLTTERLRLRPLRDDDVDQVVALLQTPEVADTTLNIPYPYPREAAEGWIGTRGAAARERGELTWGITHLEDDLLMGAVGMRIEAAHRRGTLGYWLGVPFWNQGIMSEAARAVVAYGFDTLDLHRIDAECMSRNPASAKVMQHAGMTYEGTARGYIIKHGEFEDIDRYAVIRDSDRGRVSPETSVGSGPGA